ncbi:uncharacterized protein LOC125491732 [Beta vulgaris subsp. vulgaris]|uniref:uncharacterized protein LOC125491732 n=1 Tax=Beta vulgaris subsp. vulgaris TaxID=3555 RepID=UPI002036ADD2|nr:uncharacterized protein LOC125491732 [Beta vulgaris subsp. vulgaris]
MSSIHPVPDPHSAGDDLGKSTPILQRFDEVADDVRNVNVIKNAELVKPVTQIGLEDIQEEVEYWNSAIICYVLGANPPNVVMEGFVRRIWRNLGVDKVAMVAKGVFIVRFTTMENRDKVISGGYPFFDGKPVMVKKWHPDMDFSKEDIRRVPIWIQLNLDFKYWGQGCLTKIVSGVGKFLKVDMATLKREKLQFARVLVEVEIGQEFPDEIEFENEKGLTIYVEVKYDWKPTFCKGCKVFGHEESSCRRKTTSVWVAKPGVNKDLVVVVAPEAVVLGSNEVRPSAQVGGDGFEGVRRAIRSPSSAAHATVTRNSFEALEELNEDMEVGVRQEGQVNEEGNLSISNG